jgi:ketosteroid isomerase-like protein
MARRRQAVEVARSAMAAVQEGSRDAWLNLFAPDARVEDPVHHLPPIAGRKALGEFWDNAIGGLAGVRFDVTREWAAGDDEAMVLATVSLRPEGAAEVRYDGAFNYALDAEGRIASLRGFWDLPAVAAELSGGTS